MVETHLGSVILNGDLHVAICILLLAKTLEGRVDLDEEPSVARKCSLVWVEGWVSGCTTIGGKTADLEQEQGQDVPWLPRRKGSFKPSLSICCMRLFWENVRVLALALVPLWRDSE